MNSADKFHAVTVGWDHGLIEQLPNAIAARSSYQFSHIVHPKLTADNWPQHPSQAGIYFFRDRSYKSLPNPDLQLLASLERDGVPTLHNMILGDRVVSRLPYADARKYATFLARRLIDLFNEINPSVVIFAFDAIHGGLALAVARYMKIPAFALHFSVIPPAMACFCDRMSPAARVLIQKRPAAELLELADASLRKFESREIQAHAYMAPVPRSFGYKITQLPRRLLATIRTIRRSRSRDFLKFTDRRGSYNVSTAIVHLYRAAGARKAISRVRTIVKPPESPFVLFGLHMQPESSIDVWAPFFSNQMWVVELLARSIPPTHKLLVKIHKSDVANYSRDRFEQMCNLPGVELVAPFVDTRSFIERTDLLVAIQGTMGLEAALIGKPVIMLGESPVSVFPSASEIGSLRDLPSLVSSKLGETAPARSAIIRAYANYLAPFFPASHNDWTVKQNSDEIDGYVKMFGSLKAYLESLATKIVKSTPKKVEV